MTENQTTKKRRRVNGEGSVYKRADGYWVGALDISTTSGARKRVVVYGKTLAEAREKRGKYLIITAAAKLWLSSNLSLCWADSIPKQVTPWPKRFLSSAISPSR